MESKASSQDRHRQWRKVLWDDQEFPDNHVDSSFLASLVTNANVREWDYWDVVDGAGVVSQRLSLSFLFIIVFLHLREGTVDIALLLACNWVVVSIAVLAAQVVGTRTSALVLCFEDPIKAIGNSMLIVLLLFLLAPVLHTLTRSVAEDSVLTLSVMLAGVHLAAFDYAASSTAAGDAVEQAVVGTALQDAGDARERHHKAEERTYEGDMRPPGDSGQEDEDLPTDWVVADGEDSGVAEGGSGPRRVGRVKSRAEEGSGALAMGGATSLNAAVLAAILLASRLPSTWSVFALLVIAAQAFGVVPVSLSRLRAASSTGHALVSVCLPLVTFWLHFATLPSPVLAVAFAALEVVVLFGAPWLLIAMQGLKHQIQGPWDIATLTGLQHSVKP